MNKKNSDDNRLSDDSHKSAPDFECKATPYIGFCVSYKVKQFK